MKLTGTPCHITRTMHPRVQATVKLLRGMIVFVGLLSWVLGCSILSLILMLRFMVLINGKHGLAEININEGKGART